MIKVSKLINGKYDKNTSQFKLWKDMAPRSGPRGNSNKISTQRAKYDTRKYSFTPRTAAMWNSIPEEKANAPSINSFKTVWTSCGNTKTSYTTMGQRSQRNTRRRHKTQEEEFGIEDWWILRRKTSLSFTKISSILANIGRRNSIRILNQYPFWWNILIVIGA